ncbi:MAG: YvcK family protein [Clostridium sp.]|nr:YvcK family protein [Clostridium sp.]
MQIRDFLFGLALGGAAFFFPRRLGGVRGKNSELRETPYQKYCRENGAKVAAIGGGTGLSTLLRGLKKYSSNLSAIVNVTDDGGSSGCLREKLAILPPGDIRNCLLALANTEPLLEKVFQYRFAAIDGLQGHNLGNLFLAALSDEFGFEEALSVASRVLAVKGEVLPVTLENVNLVAHFADGRSIRGESRITAERGKICRLSLDPDTSQIYPAAAQAIREAEIILVGPGSLYTSVLANLLVPGVVTAIRESKARKVYICNVMTQPGETDSYTAADHLQAIDEHVGSGIFDLVVVNNNLNIPASLLDKYRLEGSVPVLPDVERLTQMGVSVLSGKLMSHHELVRHDSDELAAIIFSENLAFSKAVVGRKMKGRAHR